jgi:ATP-dependent RNA helicase DDX1
VEVDPYNTSLFGGWNDGAGGPSHGVPTDEVHARDPIRVAKDGKPADELAASEAVKKLKPPLVVDIMDTLKMDQVLIFCRTNFDCDNLEKYLTARGGGKKFIPGQKAEKGVENPYSCCVLAGQRSMEERVS